MKKLLPLLIIALLSCGSDNGNNTDQTVTDNSGYKTKTVVKEEDSSNDGDDESKSEDDESDDCGIKNATFTSYDDAISQIRAADWQTSRDEDVESSWIEKVEFYSCDDDGYVIMTTKSGREYLHEGVPLSEFESLVDAGSVGSYYDENFKGQYQFRP